MIKGNNVLQKCSFQLASSSFLLFSQFRSLWPYIPYVLCSLQQKIYPFHRYNSTKNLRQEFYCCHVVNRTMVVKVLLNPLQMMHSLVTIDFNNTSIIDKSSHSIKEFLESWHTMTIPNADVSYNCLLTGQHNQHITKNF